MTLDEIILVIGHREREFCKYNKHRDKYIDKHID